MFNKVILAGRLTRDPELRQTPNGVAVASFSLAVDKPFNKDKERAADFFDCVAWRGTADFVSRYFEKGKPILVEGRLQNNDYTNKDGEKRRRVEVLVDNVSFIGGKDEKPAAAKIVGFRANDDETADMPANDDESFEQVDLDDLPW